MGERGHAPKMPRPPGCHIAMYVSMLIALKIIQDSNLVIFYLQFQFRGIWAIGRY